MKGTCPSNAEPVVLLEILSRRKRLLWTLTIGPVAIAIIVLLLLPNTYEMTYLYSLGPEPPTPDEQTVLFRAFVQPGLDEKDFSTFIYRFYSSSTRGLIMKKMKEAGAEKMLKKLQKADRFDKLQKIFRLTTIPAYFTVDSSGNLRMLKPMSPEDVSRLRRLRVDAFKVIITGSPEYDLLKTGTIIRSVFEQVLPVVFIRDVIDMQLTVLNARLASMESEKKSRRLELDAVRGKQRRLLGIHEHEEQRPLQNEPVLHFENLGNQFLYLPISHQAHSLRSEAERLEEDIKTVEKSLEYLAELHAITTRIRGELEGSEEKEYTLHNHKSFLDGLITRSQSQPEIRDYLLGYRRYLDNIGIFCQPVSEHPEIYRTSKHFPLVLAIVFFCGVFLALSALYVLECLPRFRAPHASEN